MQFQLYKRSALDRIVKEVFNKGIQKVTYGDVTLAHDKP